MLKKMAPLFMLLAALGFAVSAAAHLAAAFGPWETFPFYVMGLHAGIFIVFLPSVLIVNSLAKDYKQRELWNAALRGCPDWMRKALYGLFAYALVNFVYFLSVVPKGRPERVAGGVPAMVVRGFSGHWMIFYALSFATFYSYLHAEEADGLRRCANGHRVSAVARFCETCGAPVGASSGH